MDLSPVPPSRTFSPTKFLGQQADQKPWRDQTHPLPKTSVRKHRQQLAALTGERTQFLQAYLTSQLDQLTPESGDTENSRAGILGAPHSVVASRAADRRASGRSSPQRRQPFPRKSPQPILHTSNLPADAGPSPLSPPPSLSSTSQGLSFIRARPNRIVPGDQSTYKIVPDSLTDGTVLDRWPAHSSHQSPEELGVLSDTPVVRWPNLPSPLVVDDGILFTDNSLEAFSPTRHRVRDASLRDANDTSEPGTKSPSKGVSSKQLLKTVPKLLRDLEYYLNRELLENGLDGKQNIGDPQRLQIIGETFDCYNEHCSTYQPLLAKIKNEYDATIAKLRMQLEVVAPAMTKLATVEQETAADLVASRVEHWHDTDGLRRTNEGLTKESQKLAKRVSALEEDLAEKSKLIEKLEENAQNDFFQNQTLSQGLAHFKQLNAASQSLWVEKEQLQMELTEAKNLINKMSIDADGAVPRADYELLEKQHSGLQEKWDTARKEEEKKERKMQSLADKNKTLGERIEYLNAQLAEYKLTGTPRPFMDGLLEILHTKREVLGERGESTAGTIEAVTERVSMIQSKLDDLVHLAPNNDPYHLGLGPSEKIPLHLCTPEVGTRIRNRRMPKRDVEYFVKQIFAQKTADDHQRASKEPPLEPRTMQEFFHAHLVKEYIHPGMVAEVAYNLLDGCKRYNHDADIELFSKVMSGLLSEKVVKQQMKMLSTIKKTVEADALDDKDKPKKNFPSKEDVMHAVQTLCPFYLPGAYERILEALNMDCPKKGAVDWPRLFAEDSEGNQLSFVEALRDEHLHDREAYFDDLEHAICDQDPEHDGFVNSQQLLAAVKLVDPDASEEEQLAVVRQGLMIEKKDKDGEVISRELIHPMQELPHETIMFSTKEFMKLLRCCMITRHTVAQPREPRPSLLSMAMSSPS